LNRHGIVAGDRVMLLGRNSIDWVISFWAIVHAGAVVVLGNAWWSESEVDHALMTSRPRLVLTDRLRGLEGWAAADFHDLVESGAAAGDQLDLVPRAEDDPALVLFTSGTTGRAKGALLAHRGLVATMHSIAHRTRRLPSPGTELPRPSKALLSLPLFHIGGLQQILNPMVTGGTLVFTEGRFDPATVVSLVREEQIRVWSAVPTMVSRVVEHLEATGDSPVDSIRTVGMGAAPVGEHLRQKVLEWFPNAARGLAVTWGLSEAGGVVTTGAGAEITDRPGTVGRPISTATIAIPDPDANGAGEIWVRSPSVMLGYIEDEAATNETLTADRWLRTGDIGRIDADGYLFITDRSKEVVIRGGENIATPNVENRILEHPAVREAAVVGLPHPTLGEELAAVVVLDPAADVDSTELAGFVAARLAYFEVPSKWWMHPGPLPQNTTGKILKRQLRDEWLALSADSSASR
jgi:long-chain acyl-CoA synthetase